MNQKVTYILAISGGVDSVVLLHKLVAQLQIPKSNVPTLDTITPEYIVAHFDHGIREDSDRDVELVRELAKKYELEFELGEGKLGPDVSEATARTARYDFLRKVKAKHNAEKIITAHHQDDVLETMVINMIRGTGPRGLSPMSSQTDILRPLLNRTKKELIEYAKKHKLVWYEDSTNMDEKYLRNYIRLNIMPKLEPVKVKLLHINSATEKLYSDIDMRIALILPKQNILSRVWFVGLPYSVQKEFIRSWLARCGVEDIDYNLVERLTIAAKTLQIGKKTDISGKLWLISEKQNVLITSK